MNPRTRDTLIAAGASVGLFVLWELSVRLFKIPPFVLPAPSQAIASLLPVWGVVLATPGRPSGRPWPVLGLRWWPGCCWGRRWAPPSP
ncbi:hypothetical protein [Meiothermus ruber]|uniref:hypothetical protein n=1 Tax=Meiothermus ruber TaxID=277 RepID=UPI001F39A55F|nr:hypothetical protein [Meiothermus ruber]